MHVRKEAEQRAIVGQSSPHIDAVVFCARRNDERVVGELQRQHPLLWRLLGKHHAHAGLVGARRSVRRVVHLEHEVRTCRNELRHPIRPAIGFAARSVHQQHVGRGFVRFGAQFGIAETRRRKRNSHRRGPQPRRIRRTHIHHGMMHVLRARRANFRELYPLVFSESGGHDLVGVLHVAVRGNRHRRRASARSCRAAGCSSPSPTLSAEGRLSASLQARPRSPNLKSI